MQKLLLLACLLSSCNVLQFRPDPETQSLEGLLRQQWPQMTAFSSESWPPGSDRYTGLLKRVSLSLSSTVPETELRERLRELLTNYLQAQSHPEAGCISVSATRDDTRWRLEAEIVCR